MRIGIDFDNTIVSYDALFHKVALEQALIPADTPVNKVAVRDYLRRIGREPVWTELQGYVYGARMAEAFAYGGVIDFMLAAGAGGHDVFIISHKTRHPFAGPAYDLHAAASAWIEQQLVTPTGRILPQAHVFFELTKAEKIARIARCQCDLFIDDLPEILGAEGFPENTARLLFDPESQHPGSAPPVQVFESWSAIAVHVLS